jgi:hypothetical protein
MGLSPIARLLVHMSRWRGALFDDQDRAVVRYSWSYWDGRPPRVTLDREGSVVLDWSRARHTGGSDGVKKARSLGLVSANWSGILIPGCLIQEDGQFTPYEEDSGWHQADLRPYQVVGKLGDSEQLTLRMALWEAMPDTEKEVYQLLDENIFDWSDDRIRQYLDEIGLQVDSTHYDMMSEVCGEIAASVDAMASPEFNPLEAIVAYLEVSGTEADKVLIGLADGMKTYGIPAEPRLAILELSGGSGRTLGSRMVDVVFARTGPDDPPWQVEGRPPWDSPNTPVDQSLLAIARREEPHRYSIAAANVLSYGVVQDWTWVVIEPDVGWDPWGTG